MAIVDCNCPPMIFFENANEVPHLFVFLVCARVCLGVRVRVWGVNVYACVVICFVS